MSGIVRLVAAAGLFALVAVLFLSENEEQGQPIAFNPQNSFGVQPANFSDSAMMAALPEETMIMAISRGGKAVGKSQYMPPWGGTLSSGEVENVVAYIKALSKTKGVEESPKQE